MPTLPDDVVSDLPEVELIERSSYQTASPSTPTAEPMRHAPIVGTTGIAIGAVALVIIAFLLMSRPGVEEGAGIDPDPQTTLAPTTSIPGATETTGPILRPIPLFDGNVPEEVPGIISGFDDLGSVLVIDRSRIAPMENRLGVVPSEGPARTGLGFFGGQPVGFDRDLSVIGTQVVVEDSPSILRETFDLLQLAPDRDGRVLLVETDDRVRTVTVVSLQGSNASPTERAWSLESSADVLGLFQDELLVHRSGRTWLVAADGTDRPVADGDVVSYDGTHLVRMVCTELASCDLLVGTPDSPDTHRTPVPERVASLPVESWASSVAVSPDGSRLALSARNGGLSLPLVLDLRTGESVELADGMNHRSPVAWSPDGEWLAYVYTDDVMVWNLESDRSWRITLNRELQTLVWR